MVLATAAGWLPRSPVDTWPEGTLTLRFGSFGPGGASGSAVPGHDGPDGVEAALELPGGDDPRAEGGEVLALRAAV